MKQLLLVGVLIMAGAGAADLLACGDKFLMVSRGTRYQRAALARNAAILVYANPTTSVQKALGSTPLDLALRKAGYKATLVTGADELDKALRQGGWDLVVADLADSAALRSRLQGSGAPVVLPVAYNATTTQVAQAKKDYQRVVKAPVKSQAFLEAIDDALAQRERARAKGTPNA
jgi:CheY-like chemotaxis protein